MNLSVQVCAEHAHFSKNLHDVTDDFDSSVYSSIWCQETRVVQSLKADRDVYSRQIKRFQRQKSDKSHKRGGGRALPVCCRGWCLLPDQSGHGRTSRWAPLLSWWAERSSHLVQAWTLVQMLRGVLEISTNKAFTHLSVSSAVLPGFRLERCSPHPVKSSTIQF